MATYMLFFYYCQPPRYRSDAVLLLLFYAGCVGDVVRELEADSGASWPIKGALRGGFQVRAHMCPCLLLPTSALPF